MICVCPKLIMYSHVLLITIMYFRGYRYIEYYLECFGWILQKIEFIGDIGTVQSYLGKWKKIVNFDNTVAKIARKSMRKKDDKWCNGGGRKNWISIMRLLKFLLPQVAPGAMLGGVLEREYEMWQPSYWNWRVEERENMNCGNQKKLWQWYCWNRGKKNCGNWFVVMAMATIFFFFPSISAIPLPQFVSPLYFGNAIATIFLVAQNLFFLPFSVTWLPQFIFPFEHST